MNGIMFAECVIPNCRNLVEDHGFTCFDCIAVFGDMLQPSAAPRLTERQIESRDHGVTTILSVRRAMAEAAR